MKLYKHYYISLLSIDIDFTLVDMSIYKFDKVFIATIFRMSL